MDTEVWLEDLEGRVGDRLAPERGPRALIVLFDPTCSLCQRCRAWMLGQESYVRLTFLPCTGEEARRRFGDIPWLADELVVVGDGGEVWVGPAAFLVCLWALTEWREWSFRLAGPAFAPLAERFFLFLSSKRRSVAALFDHECQGGSCRVGGRPHPSSSG
jgi:predicted DCC family thiol-disulfide oxidoreductase YuxK